MEGISIGNVTDVMYLDFQKAFDTVPHKRLMFSIQAYDISVVILNWINAFLNGRTQRVSVNGIATKKEVVLSGVPQGSVLGPLLFVLYINDLHDTLICHCMMFDDDTNSFREITDVAGMNMLQNDLHQMEKGSKLGSWSSILGNALLCLWEYGGALFKRMSVCPHSRTCSGGERPRNNHRI